jgi:amidase
MSRDVGPFSTATDMLTALNARDISSVELVQMHLERIDRYDGALNAIPVRTPERALDAAKLADDARAKGDATGALLGLPMTLKESMQVAGLPQSAGMPDLRDHRPETDGLVARDVFEAGACLLGKTNIPFALADWQADSDVYGRTNNPWDVDRTPGGSTGGGAAGLATGMTPLEIGSDIGGSIRVPAAYCGVYGHRPTEGAVPQSGGFPFGVAPNPAVVMPVQGPLARSAFDLELLLDVITGPEVDEDVAWQLNLPVPRHDRLADFRVAVMPDLALVRASTAMQEKVAELSEFLAAAGAKVRAAMPEIDHEAYFRDYITVLIAMTEFGPREERLTRAAALGAREDTLSKATALGLTIDVADYVGLMGRRAAARAAWRAFFKEWDVLVCPAVLDAAYEHQTGPQEERVLRVDGRSVPYMLNIVYPMWPIFVGLPATAFPAGSNADGLPLGLQAIGRYLEDRTSLRFAQLLEREWRGFERPPGY